MVRVMFAVEEAAAAAARDPAAALPAAAATAGAGTRTTADAPFEGKYAAGKYESNTLFITS